MDSLNRLTICVWALFTFALAHANNENEPSDSVFLPSGTLPIVHIDTKDAAPIVDKVNVIEAGLWVEIPQKCPDKDWALGSKENPVKLGIRGRGNISWEMPKKPYKLKFDKKTEILGMPKHKHFALLANYGWYLTWAGNLVGFDLAKMIDLGWTPTSQPCELMLNDEYLGMYFLTETIKIDKNRLNIYEQAENNEDVETIPYGWLIEIDNYDDEAQIKVVEKPGYEMRVTHHSPEILSDAQRSWLVTEFQTICDILNDSDSTIRETWVDYIDAESLAKYFIVKEIMHDYDAFNGSFYLYRDQEENARWKAGPVWDNAICSLDKNSWTMDDLPYFSRWKLMPAIWKTQNFQNALREQWKLFYPDKFSELSKKMYNEAFRCMYADAVDAKRWGKHSDIGPDHGTYYYNYLANNAKWIDDMINSKNNKIDFVFGDFNDSSTTQYFNLQGVRIDAQALSPGVYIRKEGTKCTKILIR